MKEPQTPPCFSKSLFPLLLAYGDFGLFHSLINRINELFIILLWLINRLTCQDLNFPSLDPGYSEEGSFLHFTHTCFMWGCVSHSRLVDLGQEVLKHDRQLQKQNDRRFTAFVLVHCMFIGKILMLTQHIMTKSIGFCWEVWKIIFYLNYLV